MNIDEVKKVIKPELFTKFNKWMNGKTVGLNKDGSIDYYEHDVDRFIKLYQK
jgi:hypothetical protein